MANTKQRDSRREQAKVKQSEQFLWLGFAVLLVVVGILNAVVARTGERMVERLPAGDQPMLRTRVRLLRRVAVAVIIFVALMIVLLTDSRTADAAKAVLASSAVLGLVLGFAAKSTLANFVAGVMIAINQPVRLGDQVSVDSAEGIVEDIGLSYTRLRTTDNRRILIPNDSLASSIVTNNTIIDPTSLASVRVSVPVTADPARVRELLVEQAAAAPGRMEDRPGPVVSVAEVGADGAIYNVGVWVSSPATERQTAAWLRERCVARLNGEGLLAAPAEPSR
jgi:small-conductance mechanosensitive channel